MTAFQSVATVTVALFAGLCLVAQSQASWALRKVRALRQDIDTLNRYADRLEERAHRVPRTVFIGGDYLQGAHAAKEMGYNPDRVTILSGNTTRALRGLHGPLNVHWVGTYDQREDLDEIRTLLRVSETV